MRRQARSPAATCPGTMTLLRSPGRTRSGRQPRRRTRSQDTPGAPRPPAVDAAAEDVSPAGDWLGAGVLPPAKEVTAKPATPAAIMPAMIHTSTIGRHKRRCGRLPPGGG